MMLAYTLSQMALDGHIADFFCHSSLVDSVNLKFEFANKKLYAKKMIFNCISTSRK